MVSRRGFLGALAALVAAPIAAAKAASQTVTHGGAWVKGRWVRWTTFTYRSVSRDEFVAAVRKAARRTKWPAHGIGSREEYAYYTNYPPPDQIERETKS